MTNEMKSAGRWAVVTGGTRGIGLELAKGLIQRGYNLLIVGRSESHLTEAVALLRSLGRGEVVGLQMDLSAHDAARRLHEECLARAMEVEVLVNNAGLFAYCDLADMEPEMAERMLMLHVVTATGLCRLFGEEMRTRGCGYILNVSSYAAWLPLAGLSVYSATKSYLRDFSRALGEELRDSGVTVTALLPAGVATELLGLSERYLQLGVRLGVLMRPERVATVALKGLFAGRRRVVPGWANRAILPIVRHLPRWVRRVLRKKTVGFQK